MKILATVVLLSGLAASSAVAVSEPWQQAYSGNDATGRHVLGLWQFAPAAPTNDSSMHKNNLKLQGAAIGTGGPFGGCLESFRGYPTEDKRHAAVTAANARLSPAGAFTLELWLQPKPDLADYPESFLLDKKYVAHTDYQLTLSAADKSGQRRLHAHLGFGDGSESFTSEPARYESNTWYHLAFTYDGAGAGRFFRDGATLGGTDHPGRMGVSAGKHPLSIGDRIGSLFHGFPGRIAQVRICDGVLEFRPATLALVSERTSFVRMEPSPLLRIALTNMQRGALQGAKVTLSLEGAEAKTFPVPDLASGQTHPVEYPFDTTLRPGTYKLTARLELAGAKPFISEEKFDVVLVPRPLPFRMPVVMWGVYGPENVLRELPRLKDIGFTHSLGLHANCESIWSAGKPIAPDKPENIVTAKRMLNAALAADFGIIASLSPGHELRDHKDLWRVGRDGKPRDAKKPDICALTPGVSNFCYNVGASVAQTYGAFPAFQSALLHTEVRDGANLCFHEHDRAAYRAATGLDLPSDVTGKSGVRFDKLKDFPADRVIPDNHPLYRYLQWYWKAGDGYNKLNTALNLGLKSTGRADLWTFHDPAVRVASTYGSGGAVDAISQWTYSYPDPIRIGLATDELFAMARGAAQPQRVMKMTQIIWYRSQTAPMAKGDETKKATKSPWEDTDADAAFPTIAPLHLREAFWSKLARPVQGIMYHGWQSLVPTGGGEGSYRYTNPQTQHELRRLVKEVVEPLGPALLQVPDRRSDVAFLESFASEMFAGRGSYGWSRGWAGDAYHILQYAELQPEIVYDETLAARGLEGFRVLVLMDCDVLTASVAKKVKEFQQRGGIVIGDDRLCPALKPDLTIEVYERTRKADADRAALRARAAKLRIALDARYRRYADSANPDVVVRCRAAGTSDYLFAVNDRREFGDYVGQHGLVMENGLPSETTLSLMRAGGFVYDLVAGQPVKTSVANGRLQFARSFGPCEGGVFLATDRAIEGVTVNAPATAAQGSNVAVQIAVVDAAGQPIGAIVPLRVDIRDSAGRDAEFTGYYGAKNGQLEIPLRLARNDAPGVWQIRVRELASGRIATAYFRLQPAP